MQQHVNLHRIHRRISRALLMCALLAAAASPVAHAAPGVVETDGSYQILGCDQGTERVGPGLYLQTFDGESDVTGGIAGTPPRATLEVVPGKRTSTCVGFINRTGATVRLELSPIDVAAGRPGQAPIRLEADSPFGVADWLSVPDAREIPIKHGQILWAITTVDVPDDATAGSYYSAVESKTLAPDGVQSNTQIATGVGVQIFFKIPGDAAAAGEIVDVRAPRVVWWDGFDVGKLPVLDRMRGLGIAPIRFSWRNTGDFTDEVRGSVVIESDLGGKDVATFKIEDTIVLRQSEREFDVTWSRDIPLIGRFTPTITMRGTDGKTSTVELDPIWVIPSWWYFVALALAIGLPLWWRRRSKRRYRDLLARVEAAESRGDVDPQDESDWDQHSDEWS